MSRTQDTDPGPEPDPESDPTRSDTDADTDTDADADADADAATDASADTDPDAEGDDADRTPEAKAEPRPRDWLHLPSQVGPTASRTGDARPLTFGVAVPAPARPPLDADSAAVHQQVPLRAHTAARLALHPVYAQLTDVVTMPLCDSYPAVQPENLRFTTEYAFVFECACEVLGEHWHLGGPQEATSSSSGATSSSQGGSDSDQSSSASDLEDQERPPARPARPSSSNTTFLAPLPRSTRNIDCLTAPTAVNATLLPPPFAERIANLTNLRRLTISSSSNVLDAASMTTMGHALGSALLATRCRLTHLSIDVSSHPGAFLTPLAHLATPALRHLTLKFADASNSDQLQANVAADAMIRHAPNLETLVISGREITIPLLSTIAASPRLGTLEMHGEIIDMVGARDYTSEFWPTASTPDLTHSTSTATSTTRPRSIHTLRLYLTGGHEPLLSTIYPSLHRPLTSLSWPVALASRVYASLVLNTQSFTLQCPHNSMYLHAILNDVSSSAVLTHLQLHGYTGVAVPRRPLSNIRVLEFVDARPRALVALVSSGSVPNLGGLVVRATAGHAGVEGANLADDHLGGTSGASDVCALWAPVALLDPRVTARLLGVPIDKVAELPRTLASVHVEVALVPGEALNRVRAAVGFRPASIVPYVAEVHGVNVSTFVASVAGEASVRFPWVAATAAPSVLPEENQTDDLEAGRQVKVQVEYRERPHWTRDQSVTVVVNVRRSCW
ncbi:hypothetical protein BCR44DRAFT_1502108 [Catenaria anguillulae PL171]|uniref:Uncharacterized protein n=1 Tax=Catenaria anguillulae PL171 TaxID=765915 RepID=A0A1Y2HCJ0_9FUNG|nr:hypothetical protein BCR44DRAFT_1502108 [Catenaria anguillulae PL171]